ncbi:RICIN domain-containing protein [Streptomyces sp. NPDC006655]|uniref:RICIN domain-containing protein n=1 Tax=Streptomyces sp. NPDC006655 TaxID=3156898 RepID=UPI003453C3C3
MSRYPRGLLSAVLVCASGLLATGAPAQAASVTVTNATRFTDTTGAVVHAHGGDVTKVGTDSYWFGENRNPDDSFKCAVDGDCTYLGSFRPLGITSRDMTLYKDTDGTAYLVSSADENADLDIFRLTADCTGVDSLDANPWPGASPTSSGTPRPPAWPVRGPRRPTSATTRPTARRPLSSCPSMAEHSGKCLDVKDASTATGARLVQWPCGTGTNQQSLKRTA